MVVLVTYICVDIFLGLFAGIKIFVVVVCGKVICSHYSVMVSIVSNDVRIIIEVVLEDAGFFCLSFSTCFLYFIFLVRMASLIVPSFVLGLSMTSFKHLMRSSRDLSFSLLREYFFLGVDLYKVL